MTTPILGIPEVATNQVNQYLTVNEAIRLLEGASNDNYSVNLAAGDVTITATEFNKRFMFISSGNTVARIFTVLVSKRFFAVKNGGSFALSVKLGTTTISLAAAASGLFYCDGTANGLFNISSSGGGGGLTNFADAKSVATPNTSIPANSISATDTGANADACFIPKGTGAFLLSVPDNAATGGNKRGNKSVDLQLDRALATQVASGSFAFAAGANNIVSGGFSVGIGYGNTASGGQSIAIGSTNTATQSGSVAIGIGNTSTGTGSFAFGNNNTASGDYAIAGGNGNTASTISAVAFGHQTVASGIYSVSLGSRSTTRGITGLIAAASGYFAAVGDAQDSRLVLRNSTTTATPAALTSDAAAASTSNALVLPNGSLSTVVGRVSARQATTGDSKSWYFQCSIKRGANAAATAMVAACTPSVVAADAGAAAWTVTVTADTTNGSLKVEATGEAAKTIRWVCSIESCDVVG